MRAVVLCALGTAVLAAQDQAIVNVRAFPISGPPVPAATILLNGDRIQAVGRGLEAPSSAHVIDGGGADALPGFIDGYTTLGLAELRSVPGSVDTREIGDWNAHLRAASAVNPHSDHIPVARVNGITTVAVVPGGGVIGGRVALLDLAGRTVPHMKAPGAPPLNVLAIPRPPTPDYTRKESRSYWKDVEKSWKKLETRLGRARRIVELLDRGVEHVGRDLDGQERLSLLATARQLKAGRRWLVRADTREHILAALRFAEKHGLRLVLAGLKEGWSVKDELAKATQHRYLVGPVFSVPGREDPYDAVYANAAALHRAGVRFGFMSGSSSNVRNLPYMAAMAVAHGLPREAALRALTLGAAEALGLEKTHGSLESGKVANIVLTRGDLLDARTGPTMVFIRGRRMPSLTRHTRLARPFMSR